MSSPSGRKSSINKIFTTDARWVFSVRVHLTMGPHSLSLSWFPFKTSKNEESVSHAFHFSASAKSPFYSNAHPTATHTHSHRSHGTHRITLCDVVVTPTCYALHRCCSFYFAHVLYSETVILLHFLRFYSCVVAVVVRVAYKGCRYLCFNVIRWNGPKYTLRPRWCWRRRIRRRQRHSIHPTSYLWSSSGKMSFHYTLWPDCTQ